jgi:hypothetical protein
MDQSVFTQVERDLYTLRNAGFAIIPKFLGEDMLRELQDKALAFESEVEAFAAAGGDVPYKAGWPLQNTRALFAVDPVFERLVLDTGIINYARGYLGDCRLRDCHVLVNSPDTRNAERGRDADVNWHRDKEWADGETIVPSYLHCFVLLTDMTRENGGTLIVPGTHREREPGYYFLKTDPGRKVDGNYYLVYPQRYFPAGIQVEAPRGSLVLFDPMAIHAQGINVSADRRVVVNATFHRASLKSMIDCRRIAEKGARYKLRPEFLSLLGSGEGLIDSYGPLR